LLTDIILFPGTRGVRFTTFSLTYWIFQRRGMAAFEEMQEGPAVSINFTMGSPKEYLSQEDTRGKRIAADSR